MAGETVFTILYVAALALTPLVRRLNLRERRLRRALRRAPRVNIADAKSGQLVKLVGVARPEGQPLRAPLSGRASVGYEVQVVEIRGWDTKRLIRDRSVCNFVLEDGTGRALVQPGSSTPFIVMDAHYESGPLRDPSPEVEAYLAERRTRHDALGLNRFLHYDEGVLGVGEEIAVLAIANWEADDEPYVPREAGYRAAPRRLLCRDEPGQDMLISDDPALFRPR